MHFKFFSLVVFHSFSQDSLEILCMTYFLLIEELFAHCCPAMKYVVCDSVIKRQFCQKERQILPFLC